MDNTLGHTYSYVSSLTDNDVCKAEKASVLQRNVL